MFILLGPRSDLTHATELQNPKGGAVSSTETMQTECLTKCLCFDLAHKQTTLLDNDQRTYLKHIHEYT